MRKDASRDLAETARLLSVLFYAPSDIFPEANALVRELNVLMGDGVALPVPAEQDYASLAIDHAKLFVGPFKLKAHPYGSVYLDIEKQVRGNSTLKVEQLYAEAGVQIAAEMHEPADHISIELEFLHYLLTQNGEAVNDSDDSSTLYQFFSLFFEPFSSALAIKIQENAETAFYKQVGVALARFTEKAKETLVSSAMV